MSNSNNSNNSHDARSSGLDPSDPFLNIKKNMDDHVHETTRRVGGRGATPAMVAPSLGSMPMGFSNPAMKMPSPYGASISTATVKGQLASAVTEAKFVWNLTQVPALPECHPLERTAVFVPNSTPPMVSSRVSDLLRERSIQAKYDDDKAKVKCVTTEGVDFRIRLYRGPKHFSHGIIVEVQRRFGFSLNFHNDTQAILDAAQGKKPLPPPVEKNVLPQVSDDDEEDSGPAPPSGSASLAVVEKMLALDGFDAQYLGIQTLSSLVDPDRMSTQTARRAAVALLKSEESPSVGEKVFGYITNRKPNDDSYSQLRVMALGILANAMRASSFVPESLRPALRPVLVQDLLHAEDNTNAALLAAKCMEYFIRGDDDTMELHDAFEAARKVGEARHVFLMEQANRCIASIR